MRRISHQVLDLYEKEIASLKLINEQLRTRIKRLKARVEELEALVYAQDMHDLSKSEAELLQELKKCRSDLRDTGFALAQCQRSKRRRYA